MRASRERVAPLALLAVAVIAVPDPASAQVGSAPASVTVCPSGPPACPFTTIPDAIAAVTDGGTVRVSPGTYGGGFPITKDVQLLGSGTGSARVDGEAVTITAGTTVTMRALSFGGARETPQVVNHGTLTLRAVDVDATRAISSREVAGIWNDGALTMHLTTVSGGDAQLVGGILNDGTAVLNGSTVSESSGLIGGLLNRGSLTLNSSRIVDNSAAFEGGVRNDGSLVVRGSDISRNGGQGPGGLSNGGDAVIVDTTMHDNQLSGIWNDGNLTLRRVTVTGWGAGLGAVAGVANFGSASVVIDDSTVDGTGIAHARPGIDNSGEMVLRGSTVRNVHGSDDGAGITNSGTLTLRASLVTGNMSDRRGGGIYNTGGLMVRASTVTANTANDLSGSGVFGGGIANVPPGTTVITGSQVTGNTPDDCAGC